MTVKREYICNFCNNLNFGKPEIYGTFWSADKSLLIKGKNQSENHLCETCLDAITNAWSDYLTQHPELRKEK